MTLSRNVLLEKLTLWPKSSSTDRSASILRHSACRGGLSQTCGSAFQSLWESVFLGRLPSAKPCGWSALLQNDFIITVILRLTHLQENEYWGILANETQQLWVCGFSFRINTRTRGNNLRRIYSTSIKVRYVVHVSYNVLHLHSVT